MAGKVTKNMSKKAVGKRIRTWRKANGMTLAQVCKIIGIALGTLSELENGLTYPSAQTLAKFEKYTDINIRYVLLGER